MVKHAVVMTNFILFSVALSVCMRQGWNDLNQLIKISDLNRDLNQMIFLVKNHLI